MRRPARTPAGSSVRTKAASAPGAGATPYSFASDAFKNENGAAMSVWKVLPVWSVTCTPNVVVSSTMSASNLGVTSG